MSKMAACSDHEKTLVFDAHGALVPEERTAWERHLADCEDCRQERERLCAFLQKAKHGFPVPGLTAEEAQRLSGRVQRALRETQADARPQRMGWWLAPAFAACMVLVVAGWFGLKNVAPDTAAIPAGRAPAEAMRRAEELPATSGRMVAGTGERVPDGSIRNDEEPVEDSGHTAAITSGPPEEQVLPVDKELLENFELLQDMESLEQLVNILDKQGMETSLLETETDENHVRGLV
jgi:hypothetical protein